MEIYRVGYKSNDSYSTYYTLGKPQQLTKQQVEYIKRVNDGTHEVKKLLKWINPEHF